MMNLAVNIGLLFNDLLASTSDSLFSTNDNSISPFTQQEKQKNQDVSWSLIVSDPLVIKHRE